MEVMAKSPVTGDEQPIVAVLVSVDLEADDGVTDGEFPIAAVMFAARKLGQLQQARPIVLDGRPASVAIVNVRNDIKVLQVATASNRRGYILRCGGEKSNIDTARDCTRIASSFHVK